MYKGTLRYTKKEKKMLDLLLKQTEKTTLNKAIIKSPEIIKNQFEKIKRMAAIIDKQAKEIEELRSMAKNFEYFNKKMEEFFKNEKQNKTRRKRLA